MLGEEKEDHLLGDVDYLYEDEAVQGHGELVLGQQVVLEASRELWGKERVAATARGRAPGRPALLQCDLRQAVSLTHGEGNCAHLTRWLGGSLRQE